MADNTEGTQATGTQPAQSDAAAHIPKERLDKEIAKRRELEAQLQSLAEWKTKIETETKQAEERRLAEQGEYRKLAEERAAKVAELERGLAEERGRQREAYLKGEVRARLHDIANPEYLDLVYRRVGDIQFENGEWKGLDETLGDFRKNNPALFNSGNGSPHSPASKLHPVAGQTPGLEQLDNLPPKARYDAIMSQLKKAQ